MPVTKEVPKFSYDVRTVLVPKNVNEDYVVMETRMVTDPNPKPHLSRVGTACKSVNTDHVTRRCGKAHGHSYYYYYYYYYMKFSNSKWNSIAVIN